MQRNRRLNTHLRMRLAGAVCALAFVIALTACGKSETTRNAGDSASTTATQANQTTTATEPIEIKIEAIETTASLAPPPEPPNTVTTNLRHQNRDSYDRIAVRPANESQVNFLVFGNSRGNREVFTQLLKQASQEEDVLFAIHLGDMVSSATEQEYDAFLAQVREQLKIPLLTIPGSNDLGGGKDSSLYRQIFGYPMYYHFRIGRTAFLMIDNSRPEALDDAQLRWVRRALSSGMNLQHRLVFMSKPLFDPRVGGKQGTPKDQAEKLMDLFAQYQINRIFSASIPGFYSGSWAGARYHITGGAGTALAGHDADHDFHHYLVVKMASSNTEIIVRPVKMPGAGQQELKDFKVP